MLSHTVQFCAMLSLAVQVVSSMLTHKVQSSDGALQLRLNGIFEREGDSLKSVTWRLLRGDDTACEFLEDIWITYNMYHDTACDFFEDIWR